MVILCEECNYFIENTCRHFGKTDSGQQREKNIRSFDKDHSSINEILKPESAKKDLLWQELLELHKQYVQLVQGRKRAIAVQLQDILTSDFWDNRCNERPIME